jgi:serine/threonine-protein kinase
VDGAVLKKGEKDDNLIGQVLAGKYRIDEKIDEGGMGCVYRATHVLMEKTVAIKVLHPALAADDKIVARFTREAKAASRISHPHAINVTDFGESENGVVYMVMEYLRGRTLKDIVRDGGPMPLARAVTIVRQVAGALDAAHAEGVIHRDLKSDNIMLEEVAGGGDWAKVLDFGIAKIQQSIHETDPGLTAPNLIIGTPQYMSPEQCSQASDIDARSDIYSFGVIIYEMLAGHVPFTGDSPTAIMLKHIQEPPPSVLDERKDLPAGVGRVVTRALAKRPEDRYEKACDLADALEEAAKEEVAAVPTGPVGIVDTDRIIVPTSPNDAPRTTLEEDEATVVSARHARPTTEELPPPVAPPPVSSFNPWRIAVPAIAALVIIFAVVYAVQRRGSSAGAQPADQPALKTDPNGQPVQPLTPPTGQAERNIAPVANTSPSPATIPGQIIEVPGGVPANANAAPTPRRGKGENQNGQPEVVNDNQNGEEPEATPTPVPRNKRLPNINANVEAPTPAPPNRKPVPKKVDEITPTPTPDGDKTPQPDDSPPLGD